LDSRTRCSVSQLRAIRADSMASNPSSSNNQQVDFLVKQMQVLDKQEAYLGNNQPSSNNQVVSEGSVRRQVFSLNQHKVQVQLAVFLVKSQPKRLVDSSDNSQHSKIKDSLANKVKPLPNPPKEGCLAKHSHSSNQVSLDSSLQPKLQEAYSVNSSPKVNKQEDCLARSPLCLSHLLVDCLAANSQQQGVEDYLALSLR
jgi:hypothetical protein